MSIKVDEIVYLTDTHNIYLTQYEIKVKWR